MPLVSVSCVFYSQSYYLLLMPPIVSCNLPFSPFFSHLFYATEHVTAVASAMRNKMDLAIQVAIGSSLQIALFVTPLFVIIGWIMKVPMTLDFKVFETSVLFCTIFVVNALIQDGRSNWLEGWFLLASYLLIAVAFYFL